jgi:nitrogen fixation protein FixH
MKRGTWWPIAITGVLATTVAANIWVMRIANDDPSFAIEPDYYKKAISWDSTLGQARTNAQLGWRLTPALGPLAPGGGARLTARLSDSNGAAITGATVRVSAMQVARASDVHNATLDATAAGEYGVQLDAKIPGQWELRFDVRAGSTHFTETARVEARVAQ